MSQLRAVRLSRQTELEVAAIAPSVRKFLLRAAFAAAVLMLATVMVTAGMEAYLLSLKPHPAAVSKSGFAFSIRSASR